MKKILIVLLFLCTPFGYALLTEYGATYIDDNANINIYRLKYEPYPASPGAYVDTWIKIQNSADYSTEVNFKLLPKYPFSLDGSETAERKLGELSAGETRLLHYKIRVASDAIEGSAPLQYEVKTSAGSLTASVDIWIQTIDSDILISSVENQRLVPGKVTPVIIGLENTGDSPITDVRLELDFTAAALPIVPVDSSNEKKIYMIEGKSKQNMTFNLMPLPGAAANTYKVPIVLKFVDKVGDKYNKSGIIGLVVGAEPDLDITISNSEIYRKGNTGDISLKLINKGLSDIKLVNIELMESPNYDILSEERVYLGNVDSDDYETADFRIKAKKVENGVTRLAVTLDYLDANNNEYSETRNVELKVVSAKKLGMKTKGSGTIIVVIIIMAAGLYFYKKWEKKKTAKK